MRSTLTAVAAFAAVVSAKSSAKPSPTPAASSKADGDSINTNVAIAQGNYFAPTIYSNGTSMVNIYNNQYIYNKILSQSTINKFENNVINYYCPPAGPVYYYKPCFTCSVVEVNKKCNCYTAPPAHCPRCPPLNQTIAKPPMPPSNKPIQGMIPGKGEAKGNQTHPAAPNGTAPGVVVVPSTSNAPVPPFMNTTVVAPPPQFNGSAPSGVAPAAPASSVPVYHLPPTPGQGGQYFNYSIPGAPGSGPAGATPGAPGADNVPGAAAATGAAGSSPSGAAENAPGASPGANATPTGVPGVAQAGATGAAGQGVVYVPNAAATEVSALGPAVTFTGAPSTPEQSAQAAAASSSIQAALSSLEASQAGAAAAAATQVGAVQPSGAAGSEGTSPAGSQPAGQAGAGQSSTGEIPAGQAPGGQNPAGQAPAGQAPAGSNPTGPAAPGSTEVSPLQSSDSIRLRASDLMIVAAIAVCSFLF